jgi:hypothetical protein
LAQEFYVEREEDEPLHSQESSMAKVVEAVEQQYVILLLVPRGQ